jgi:hypothetical protein
LITLCDATEPTCGLVAAAGDAVPLIGTSPEPLVAPAGKTSMAKSARPAMSVDADAAALQRFMAASRLSSSGAGP